MFEFISAHEIVTKKIATSDYLKVSEIFAGTHLN